MNARATQWLCRWLGVVLLASAATQSAHADASQTNTQNAETIAAARALAVEGVKLARAGYCVQALPKLQQAEALHHSIVVATELGDCLMQTGKVVAASEALRRVAREALPEGASTAVVKAKERADALFLQTSATIAQLTIDVSVADAPGLEVTIDGQTVPNALLGVARPTDPGAHLIAVSAPGYQDDRAHVELSARDSQRVQLALRPIHAATLQDGTAGSPDVSPAVPEPSPVESATMSPKKLAGYVLLASGAVGLAAGIGFGAAAWHLKLQLDDRCDGRACPASERAELNAAQRWGLSSTVAMSVGAASAIVGSLLLLLERRHSRRDRDRKWSLTGGMRSGAHFQTRF